MRRAAGLRCRARVLGALSGLLAAATPCRLIAQSLATVRFTVGSSAAVDSVRGLGIDLVEVRPRSDRRVDLVAVITPRDRDLLASRGWPAVDLAPAPQAAALEARRAQLGARAFTVYRDFDDPVRGVAAYLRAFAASHANVTVDSIGASTEGRPILIAKIGAPTDDPSRPNVLFMATYHAREWAATEMALRLLQYLADSLPAQPAGNALLAGRDVWVLPVANPDGYQFTFTGDRLWRKNRRPNGDGTFGVDLNRNHTAYWGYDNAGSSALTGSEIYRGPSAASEPEIRAVEAFHRAHPPVASISYHTYTGAVLYPWGHANGLRTGDDAIFRALAGTDLAPAIPDSLPGSANTYYHPGPGWHLYPTNGEYTEYAYRTFRTAAFTVELTAGCCVGGHAYGFSFPDDDALLGRMASDNIPFALTLLREASNLTANAAFPGAAGAVPQFESVWPELRVLLDISTQLDAPVDVAIDSGVVGHILAPRDSLGIGRRFMRRTTHDFLLRDTRAVRLPLERMSAEILMREGAELPTTAWLGFRRTAGGFEGEFAWNGYLNTLVSPPIPVAGRTNLTLVFWTKHGGSVFLQTSRGRVQVSGNNGTTWTEVADVVGAAPEWYPIATPLGAVAAGASTLRLRFIAEGMDWWLDAVTITASDGTVGRLLTTASARAPTIETSANPVRDAPVTLRWPASTGTTQVDVFSLTGTRVASVALSPDSGRWAWDLTTENGGRIANGAYFVVVTQADGTRMRRRLLVARTGP